MNSEKKYPGNKITSERMLWADIIRIIAIYLVVQVHTFSIPVNWHLTFIFVSRFDQLGVPLFVMLSGALLLGKQEVYGTFFRKRCMKVLFPWIVWTIIYMCYFFYFRHAQVVHDYFLLQNGLSLSAWAHFFFRTFMSNLWFLPMIFIVYLGTPLLRIFVKYAKEVDSYYCLALWFLFFSLLPFIFIDALFPRWEPNIFFAPLQYSGYYLLGYFLIKIKIFSSVRIPVLFLASILPITLSLLPLKQSAIEESVHGYLAPGIVISSLFFFYFLFAFSNRFSSIINTPTKYVIAMVSKASFGVYLIHGIIFDVVYATSSRLLHQSHLEIFITLIIFTLSTCAVLLLQKVPFVRYIFPYSRNECNPLRFVEVLSKNFLRCFEIETFSRSVV